MKSYLLPAFLLVPLSLFTQTEQILADPAIKWAAEIELTLPVDPLKFSTNEDRTATLAVLQLNEPVRSLGGYVKHSLTAKLWEMAENG